MLVAAGARPQIADQFAAHLVWMSQHKLLPGRFKSQRECGAGKRHRAQIPA
jgi:sulfate adenylyltransferase subunit 1 (EFTu-like GTPase family)